MLTFLINSSVILIHTDVKIPLIKRQNTCYTVTISEGAERKEDRIHPDTFGTREGPVNQFFTARTVMMAR